MDTIPTPRMRKFIFPAWRRFCIRRLFPVGQEFFASHASLTIFPNLIAFSLRVTHLPMEAGLFLWHLASIFLLLLACWELSSLFFLNARARWGGVCLVAALLTIPVAGTALYIMDQYLNPRNLAAFAVIFAVARILEKKYVRAALWLAFAGSVHPLMAAFAFSFCFLLVVGEKFEKNAASRPTVGMATGLGCVLPFGISLDPPTSPAYHAAAMRHEFHYIQLWHWYEQLGILAPVVLFWWFARIARARQWRRLELVCRALIVYDLVYFVAALVVDLPARFESLARLQPLRSLHLLYMLMFLIMGGFLGEFVLKNRSLALAGALCSARRGDVCGPAGAFSGERSHRVAGGVLRRMSGRRPLSGFVTTRQWMRCLRSIPILCRSEEKIRSVSVVWRNGAGWRTRPRTAAR